jgi:hypothetical protein
MSAGVYRESPQEPSAPRIRRSPAATLYDLVWAAVRLGVAAIPVLLFASWLTWIVTVLLGLGVLMLVVAALALPGVAACPGCGAPVGSLSLTMDCVGHQCDRCLLFVENVGGQLVPTPLDRTDDTPSFGVVVGSAPGDLPELCCVCGAPATRRLPLQKGGKPYVDMPYCSAHQDGARVKAQSGRDVLYMRSLGFARALAAHHGGELVGTNRGLDQPKRIPWGQALFGLGGIIFGVGLNALLAWAEQSGAMIGGNAIMVLLYALLGKKILAGIFVSIGTFGLMGFVMGSGWLLRRRLGLG